MAIQVSVTANKVTISNKNTITVNQGEYNINDCIFTFSEEYNNLSKRAIFSNVLGKKFLVEIDANNQCIIPESILTFSGVIGLNVYAYAINEDGTLNLRYSPTPDSFTLQPGSYIEGVEEFISPETALDLIGRVERTIAEANSVIDKLNSIRFEIDSNGYLILIEND